MKKIQAFLLSAVCILAAALPAAAQQSVTITLKDSTTRSFTSIDSVRLVGGNFGDPMGVGVKIYVNGSTQSHDFLYSQMLDIVITGQTITVATPVFSPNGGEFLHATTVTISCATTGAIIYYTTDGSTPTATHGTRYTGPITIDETTTLSAIAIKDGVSSTLATATFTLVDN
ncbi:MAG: chitobiase/beta-hexosaminidase C-terminal domain-containing protein, partial [Muribaculaceae bacterium]|nr:chitobiase/beta-hexosaminidase C-terminal domain-containing protein [Muribaculaceae bacterium]